MTFSNRETYQKVFFCLCSGFSRAPYFCLLEPRNFGGTQQQCLGHTYCASILPFPSHSSSTERIRGLEFLQATFSKTSINKGTVSREGHTRTHIQLYSNSLQAILDNKCANKVSVSPDWAHKGTHLGSQELSLTSLFVERIMNDQNYLHPRNPYLTNNGTCILTSLSDLERCDCAVQGFSLPAIKEILSYILNIGYETYEHHHCTYF